MRQRNFIRHWSSSASRNLDKMLGAYVVVVLPITVFVIVKFYQSRCISTNTALFLFIWWSYLRLLSVLLSVNVCLAVFFRLYGPWSMKWTIRVVLCCIIYSWTHSWFCPNKTARQLRPGRPPIIDERCCFV